MLSRTADHLFWMARYTERAEYTARVLDANVATSMLRASAPAEEAGWNALLSISELRAAFDARYAELTAANVLDFMVRDPDNPSSIYCCLRAARENARAVRGVLPTEVWETHNDTWLRLSRQLADGALTRDPQQFFEWVKFRSHLARGVTLGTMLKDEAFYFLRLGTFLERADNTARLLDVKFRAAALPAGGDRGGATFAQHFDFYYWAAILRSLSAFEVYRKAYRNVITPARVAELLILREDMPRSLAACMNEICDNLQRVRNARSRETERRAGLLRAELQYGRAEDILARGLHDFLTVFLQRVADLGTRISEDFLLPLTAA